MERCASQRGDVRSHWKLVNNVVNRIKHRPPPAAEITALNRYFHSIVTNPDQSSAFCPYGPYSEASFTNFDTVNQLDIARILSTLDAAKSSGPDGIPTPIIKMLAPEISHGLPILFNRMLQEGLLPHQFKFAHVTPVYKRGNPTLPDNYRPISLLPVLSKVLERIVFDQLTSFIESNPDLKVLPPEQFAYRRGHSTEDALTLAIDHWSRTVDTGQMTAVCFADMSKAFDRVNHQQLLEELHSCGIGSSVLQWFRNFLCERRQAVKIGINVAPAVHVSRGVPQGSVLGPVLYSIYVRRIPTILKHVSVIQYADDICFFTQGNDPAVLSNTLSTALEDLNSYLQSRSLVLNPNKTEVMLVTSARRPALSLQVTLNGTVIKQVNCARYLGLHIDSHLTFSTHVEKVVAKVAGLIFALRRHRHKLDIKSRRMYYLTLIQPHFEYASNAFSNLLSSQLTNMLTVAANNGVRAIFGLPAWVHVSSLYQKLQIAPLHQRYALKCYIVAYKCANNLSPAPLAARFQLNIRQASWTRQNTFCTFKLPHVSSQTGLNSFSFIAADRFNGLPADLRSSSNLLLFISLVKEFIGYPRREGHRACGVSLSK